MNWTTFKGAFAIGIGVTAVLFGVVLATLAIDDVVGGDVAAVAFAAVSTVTAFALYVGWLDENV